MDADAFFQTLFDDYAIEGKWVRGNVIDIILDYVKLRDVPGIVWSMTGEIPQRPNAAEINSSTEYIGTQAYCDFPLTAQEQARRAVSGDASDSTHVV
jgi:hypothetical protein